MRVRRSAEELGLDPLLVTRPGVAVVVDNSRAELPGAFPIALGLDIDAAGAASGTRYLVLAAQPGAAGGTTLVGEVELTDEACPPGSDGSPLACIRCPDERGVRFARWVDTPKLPAIHDEEYWLARPPFIVVGPLTPHNRAQLSRSQVRMPCREDDLEGTWWCDMGFDLGGDGQFDFLDMVNDCPQLPPPHRDAPRCFYGERWRWHEGRWWATDWKAYGRARGEPARRPEFLEVFEAIWTPLLEPEGSYTHEVFLEGITGERRPRGNSPYLLVDGRTAVALVKTRAAPDNERAFVTLKGTPRQSMYAVGPVSGSWAELSRARVRTDFAADSRVRGLPYEFADRNRVVVAVDLDADGDDEVQLLASGARSIGIAEQPRLVRFDLRVGEGEQRHLRETMFYWVEVRKALVQRHCDFEGSAEGRA